MLVLIRLFGLAGSATQLHLRLAGLLAELLQDTETDVARLCQRIFAVGKI